MASSLDSGSVVARNYRRFRGVDFSNRKDEVDLTRSPDASNIWINYKSSNGNCIETRPDIEEINSYEDRIHGIYFFNGKMVLHVGKKLYHGDKVIFSQMSENKSKFFIYEKNLYIKDNVKYLVYDGASVKEVEGYIPTTHIGKEANGGEGQIKDDINLLSPYRKNQFRADGTSKEYFLDVESFDADYYPVVSVDGNIIDKSKYTPNYNKGSITFKEAPTLPLTDGQDNVVIQFKKVVEGNRAKIEECTLLEVFDNRVFFSGNPKYPNKVWLCSLNDPSYCSDMDSYPEGVDDSPVKALISGNNALWVMKAPSQTNTTIFYHNPTLDDVEGKIYPSTHSSVSTGCTATGINFNDDIVFFGERGLEGISGDVTTEQVLSHRSTLVDNKLLNEENYENMILIEWEGYMLVIIDNKIYLANSRALWSNNGQREYEWFYWEFKDKITNAIVENGTLYLCMQKTVDDKLYDCVCTLTNTKNNRKIDAYFTTLADEMSYPQMWKTTNKKATVIDVVAEQLLLEVKTDNKAFTKIGTFNSKDKGYVKPRIKAKKFKAVQLKFSSSLPFSLYSCTLEAYLGNVVKR